MIKVIMKPYKIGDGLIYNGEQFTIYDVCRPCRKVYAFDKEGVKHLFKWSDGGLKLYSKQNEPEEDRAVRMLLYETLGKKVW